MCWLLQASRASQWKKSITANLRHHGGAVCAAGQLPRHIDRPGVDRKSTKELRHSFIEFFRIKYDHSYVPPVSLLPKRDAGTFFTNAGMNQFKPIFLGTVDPHSPMGLLRRAVNSQKCIRISGKHNDLDDVGYDGYHHTFFEMLGNWSFGDYYKEEACAMMWEFLTCVLKLPPHSLYVTYFGGSREFGLPPDDETRDIWLNLGVSDQKILAFDHHHNFWEMGETGPCGPSTEIHLDQFGGTRCARCFVNSGSPEVIELWNSVFISHQRTPKGTLVPLAKPFVDTGMGLERLAAVVQGVTSTYDTDSFVPILDQLSSLSPKKQPYSGYIDNVPLPAQVPSPKHKHSIDPTILATDVAYRIVADHCRAVVAAMGDGLLPGRQGWENRLRHLLQRAARQAVLKLGLKVGDLALLVPTVVKCLDGVGPTPGSSLETQIVNLVRQEEVLYAQVMEKNEKAFEECLSECPPGVKILSESQVSGLLTGRYNQSPLSLDWLGAMTKPLGITFTLPRSVEQKEKQAAAREAAKMEARWSLVDRLRSDKVPGTRDEDKYVARRGPHAGYEYPPVSATILAVFARPNSAASDSQEVPRGARVTIVVDRTNLYAQAGGQVSDWGTVVCPNTGAELIRITEVEQLEDWTLHHGEVVTPAGQSVVVGQHVHLCVDQARRLTLSRHHTGSHLLMWALSRSQALPSDARTLLQQRGSSVEPHRLKLHVSLASAQQPISAECLAGVEEAVRNAIQADLPLRATVVPLDVAQQVGCVRSMPCETYPSAARVVSIGADWPTMLASGMQDELVSAELCCGTHVERTSDVGHFVVTALAGQNQTVKEITAVVGPQAEVIQRRSDALLRMVTDLEREVRERVADKSDIWGERLDEIDVIIGQETLGKLAREQILTRLDPLRPLIAEQSGRQARHRIDLAIDKLLTSCDASAGFQPLVAELCWEDTKFVMRALDSRSPSFPVLLYNGHTAICYVPPNFPVSSLLFADQLANQISATGTECSLQLSIQTPRVSKREHPTTSNNCTILRTTSSRSRQDRLTQFPDIIKAAVRICCERAMSGQAAHP